MRFVWNVIAKALDSICSSRQVWMGEEIVSITLLPFRDNICIVILKLNCLYIPDSYVYNSSMECSLISSKLLMSFV